ncbi:MAG: type II TA system antitoxin MqsA family protein [Verrucomicrobiales bacterium]
MITTEASLPRTETTESIPCFECESGELKPTLQDYASKHPKLGEFTVPDVPVLVCDQCGDTVIGEEGNAKIDAWLDKALNVISPEEIRQFLDKYSLTQKEASRITGLGEKNICRWLGGRSRPSESVSNLLRLLLADETAFERLKQRNFSQGADAPVWPAEERQPEEEEAEILSWVDFPKLVEIGLVEKTRSPLSKRTQLCRLGQCSDLVEFREKFTGYFDKMAAFKDTGQRSNPVSAGLWAYLGEKAARHVETAPFHRDDLRAAVKQLRELTSHPLEESAEDVKEILARAGVALVFVPVMKESALRGCTRLITSNKAVIIHGLKYRNLSQFWIILFHEIAHLLLHITKPGEVFTDYDDQTGDGQERDADAWAYDTLVSMDRELEFRSQSPEPGPNQLLDFANELRVHPAIVAEIFNKRAGGEIISYSRLKKAGLFPHLDEAATRALMATSRF